MKIAIIGTGGVGGYFGAKLAKAGHEVIFLARGKHLQAMQTDGLTVKSIKDDFKIEKVTATDSIKSIGPVDLVMVCVKAWQVKEAALELATIVTPDTLILPLQNGVLAAQELGEHLPARNVLGGLCRIISKIEAPGVINHFGVEPTIIFGELDNQLSARTQQLQQVFEQADIQAKVATDIQAELWKKFIGICVSGLLAITRSTYGQVLDLPQTRQLLVELLTEVYTLSQRIGINIETDFVARTILNFEALPPESTASLTRDVWEGKPSEIEYQNGTVVKLAEQYNVPVPVNRFIYHCILPMEKKARQQV
ncbi:ketopantoate reductase family protein [Pontibacter cellulosilyticus]|uniref:2-dehydropantoate 2-reductase n=1 Tax=Pontibacter cellulosilyticus TaxID=1720253 RepID=A0A923SIV2_9BACT|nr:2-dehydropantoate 2-reductase [Pontibacter cellulosilyticus]MBC5993219.1 2-dehydropantoate 2-reductase [Pontibacter cellulosilyticus]